MDDEHIKVFIMDSLNYIHKGGEIKDTTNQHLQYFNTNLMCDLAPKPCLFHFMFDFFTCYQNKISF
jgi:hypothetical protein